jgi:hypothetical protein
MLKGRLLLVILMVLVALVSELEKLSGKLAELG